MIQPNHSAALITFAATTLCCTPHALAQDWQHTGGPHGGRLTDVAASSSHAFAASTGGLARFDPASGSWQLLPTSEWIPPASNPGVVSIAALPGAVLVSTTAGEVIRSFDSGDTWHETPGLGQAAALLADGDRLYASAGAGLHRSLDQGSSWQPINFPGGAGFHARGDVLLAGSFNSYFVSLDGGATFDTHPIPPVGFAVPAAFASTSHGFYMAVNSLTSSNAALFRSTDQGASFQPMGNIGRVLDTLIEGDTVYLLTEEHTFFTNRLWIVQAGALAQAGVVPEGFQSVRELRLAGLGGDLIVGTPDVGALRSSDGGQTWSQFNAGLGFTLVTNMAASDGLLLAALASDHSVWRLENGAWSATAPLPGGGNILSIHHVGGPNFIAGTDREGIFRSSDDGATWTPSSGGLPQYNGSAGLQYREVEDLTHTGSAIFAALGFGTEMINGEFRLSGGGLVRSTDGGASWQRVNNGLPIQFTNNFGQPVFDPFISMAALPGAVFAGSGSTGLWRSTDNGNSWQQVSPISTSVADLLALNGRVYAAATEGVFVSHDAGDTWTNLAFPLTPRALGAAGGQLFAAAFPFGGTAGGIYRLDEGIWQPTGDPFATAMVHALTGDGNTLYAGTHHLGVWSLGGPQCYPNCDGSTAAPTLNIADFTCFLQRFASGDAYANCDASTTAPVLNVADFTCFLQSFAQGCP